MNNNLRRAIRQILLAGSTTAFTVGAFAALGPQMPPPGPGLVPDYFGAVPNYANSPQPVLATASIATGGAVLAATTYNYTTGAYTGGITDIKVVNPGSGYSVTAPPTVAIAGSGTGAAASARVNGILGFNVIAGGSGYVTAPLVTISAPDIPGGIQATATAILGGAAGDVVTGIQIVEAGSGYTLPPSVIFSSGIANASAIINPTPGKITSVSVDLPGTGYSTPIAGTGIHKFVDGLPLLNAANNLGQQLPIAVPDTTSFPGSDYYEIAETEYTQKLHTDLQATHLRGYKQLNAPAGSAAASNQYLGPIIVAQRDRPVRIKLVNQLSKSTDVAGPKGNLPIPVDTTYMGSAQTSDTPNRTALHLHGGNTPWISDGTPRQTVKPKGEVVPNKGESARDVPDMWFDATGALLPTTANCKQGTTVCNTPGATNNPGDGALTFFYTNEQSARLMFYHDHAEGITRLNVYDGLAAGYVLQDPTEQAMVNGGTAQAAALAMGYSVADAAKYDATTVYPAALPPLTDTIPLVIQEKTFVPNNTTPVLNFYGAFASQLSSQDPTWRWGSKAIDPVGGNSDSANGTGDLWFPHIFMPNQNPGDITGANPMGRWDYGPWFWPPFTGIQHGPIANPYYDPACVSSLTKYCEGPTIPGVPNGNIAANLAATLPAGYPAADLAALQTLGSPSATSEAFNDTPLVNGTAYPKLNVEPKKYRLRILSVGNDRTLNLSLVVAASKNTDTTANANAGPRAGHQAVPCDGVSTYPATYLAAPGQLPAAADCTEVKMVPFNTTQNLAANTPFPAWWYTAQKAGVTFDGRPSGVFDPATRGPAMVQIGTEGGFLSSPAVIKNQPVNFEYNPKNIVIGNIKEHALLLGPAERADVVVDFSQFAGSTLILYNDAPAPVPAFDLRVDYYTGGFDNTDTGGAFSTIPGYGPNSRTIMQIQVANACTSLNCGVAGVAGLNRAPSSTRPVDDVDAAHLTTLTTAVRNAFKTSQEPIIVPQAAYNPVYGTAVADATKANLSLISDNWLTYNPLNQTTLTIDPVAEKLFMQPKSIIEDWTRDYGRMNAMLGTEIPNTTAVKANAIPQAYIDPPTELVKISQDGTPITGTLPDGTQLWKVTHNGVDTHAIHFHLFHVQIVNRVGWDGQIRAPSANELGWKDTVLMNPLEDIVVALRPKTMTKLPFKVPNSHRKLDTSGVVDAAGNPMFFNFNPITGNPSVPALTNQVMNFGWEYVWHCHILGHEENDMMRAIAVADTPETPSGLVATPIAAPGTGVKLDWIDNSMVSNWVQIQRATDAGFVNDTTLAATNPVTRINVPVSECTLQAGCARTYTDSTAAVGKAYFYRVTANNTVGGGNGQADVPPALDGTYGGFLPVELASLTPNFAGYGNVTASSGFSNTASLTAATPFASVTPVALTFAGQVLNTTSAAQTVTLTNTGTAPMTITSVALSTPVAPAVSNYAISSNGCPATLASGASCNIGVTFKPTTTSVVNGLTDTLTITSSATPATQTVSLQGTGVAPVASVVPAGPLSFGNQVVETLSAAQSVTLSNTGNAPLSITGIALTGQFVQSNNCGTSVVAGASCSINVSFQPTTLGAQAGSLTITDNSTGIAGTTQTVNLSGNSVVQLNAPTNLKAVLTNTAGTTVKLTWTDTSHGETGYVVQQALITGGVVGAYAPVTNCTPVLAANAITCTQTAVPQNQQYSYQVYAVDGTVNPAVNGPAATVSVSTLPAPNSFQGQPGATTGSTDIAWNDLATIETGYAIQHCTATGTSTQVATICNSPAGIWTNANPASVPAGSGGMNSTDSGLISGNRYRYRITAVDAATGTSSLPLTGGARAQ